ncbi:hypothetical protein DD606_25700 [Enterobacter cloacae complex sp. GF14B]|nr:hypothetical protein DD606_25700 [Enterobacter cloacae complex sp. GF14B]
MWKGERRLRATCEKSGQTGVHSKNHSSPLVAPKIMKKFEVIIQSVGYIFSFDHRSKFGVEIGAKILTKKPVFYACKSLLVAPSFVEFVQCIQE